MFNVKLHGRRTSFVFKQFMTTHTFKGTKSKLNTKVTLLTHLLIFSWGAHYCISSSLVESILKISCLEIWPLKRIVLPESLALEEKLNWDLSFRILERRHLIIKWIATSCQKLPPRQLFWLEIYWRGQGSFRFI